MAGTGRLGLLALLALWLGGCATLPDHVERLPSSAEDGSGTALCNIVDHVLPGDPLLTVSGFRLLPTGGFALDARLALAARAKRTLDVQYYLIANDETGVQFLAALKDAALRGVRVRILLDDFYTSGEDSMLEGLAAYPNVEIRLFNPMPLGRGSTATRLLMSLGELARVNRRMHNKLFIADNCMAISGGRNIANEYFTRAGTNSFVDLDVLSAGPVVKTLSSVFDTYWMSDVVYPLFSIDAPPRDPLAAQREFDHDVDSIRPDARGRKRALAASPQKAPSAELGVTPLDDDDVVKPAESTQAPLAATDPLGHRPVSEDLESGDMELHQAIAEVLADSPQKAAGLNSTTLKGTVTLDIDEEIAQARSEILIVSPYLVPGKTAMANIRDAIARGVKITIVTNSLAASDAPIVYVGYRRDRMQLLRLGVTIYELSPQIASARVKLGDFRSQLGRLHAKAVMIDGRRIFVGSMNMDGRSGHENTETGIILESQTFAAELKELIDRDIELGSYRVRLNKEGSLVWVSHIAGHEQIVHEEPGVSFFEKAYLDMLAPFAPESLL